MTDAEAAVQARSIPGARCARKVNAHVAPFVRLKRIPAGTQHSAQVERQREKAPVGFGVVEKALAMEACAVGVDARGFEAREIDPVAAGQEGPIGIEGGHVRKERSDVGVVAAKRTRHFTVQCGIVHAGGARLKRVNAPLGQARFDQREDVVVKERIAG